MHVATKTACDTKEFGSEFFGGLFSYQTCDIWEKNLATKSEI